MGRTVYPDYDFARNDKMMHFGTFIRKEFNGENYLIPVVRHYTASVNNPITDEVEMSFLEISKEVCEEVLEKYIIDQSVVDGINGFKMVEKEEYEEEGNNE